MSEVERCACGHRLDEHYGPVHPWRGECARCECDGHTDAEVADAIRQADWDEAHQTGWAFD